MELKFRKVGEDFSLMPNATVKELRIKPFYTIGEMATIYNDMIVEYVTDENGNKTKNESGEFITKPKDSLDEYFAKVVLTTRLCTNLDLTDIEQEDIFNLAMTLKLDKVYASYISQYTELDNMMKREKSTEKVIEEFLGKAEVMLKNVDTKGMFEKFKDVATNAMKADKEKKNLK